MMNCRGPGGAITICKSCISLLRSSLSHRSFTASSCNQSGGWTLPRLRCTNWTANHSGTFVGTMGWNGPYVPVERLTCGGR